MSLVTLEAVKSWLKITASTWDVDLQSTIDGAEVTVARWLGLDAGLASASYTEVCLVGNGTLVLRSTPLVSLTSVVDGYSNSVDLSTLVLDNAAGLVRLDATTWLQPSYTVTYVAGFTADTLPTDIAVAVKELSRDRWSPQRGGSSRESAGTGAEGAMSSGYARAKGICMDARMRTVA